MKIIALQFCDELHSQLPRAAFLTAADGCVVEHQGPLNPRCLARIKNLQSQCPMSWSFTGADACLGTKVCFARSRNKDKG